MARAVPADLFQQFSGKLSSKGRIVLRTRNGRTHAYLFENPYKGPLSEKRQKSINRFTQALRLYKIEISDPAKLAVWQERYISYSKIAKRNPSRAYAMFIAAGTAEPQPAHNKVYRTLRGFIIASLTAQLKSLE